MAGRVITSSGVGSNTGLDAPTQSSTTSTGASPVVSDGGVGPAAGATSPAAAGVEVAYNARVEDEKIARSVYDLGVAGIPGLLEGDPSPARGLSTFSGGFGTTPSLVSALNKVAEELDLTHRVLNVKAFGAVGDGVTDDTAAFVAAAAAGTDIHVPDGVFCVSLWALNSNTTKNRSYRIRGVHSALYSGDQKRSVIKGIAANEIIRVGDTDTTAGSSSPMQVSIEDIILDGGGVATTGLRVTRGVNLTFKRMTATSCLAKGFFVDGTVACSAGGAADLNNITFESCYTTGCGTNAGDGGLVIDAPGVVIGSFDNIRISNHQSGINDKCGIRVKGVPGVHIMTSVLQPSAGNGIEVVDGEVTIDSTYIECGGTTLVVTASTFGGSHVKVRSSSIGNPSVDANSSVTYDGSYPDAKGYAVARFTVGRPCDDAEAGPPNQEILVITPKTGAEYKRGRVWIDSYGIAWICVESGVSQAAKFVPRDGKIIVPLRAASMTNGNTLFWAQDDMLIRNVSVVCGGSYAFTNADAGQFSCLSTYLGNVTNDLIELAQLPQSVTTGVNEAVVQASKNTAGGSRMNNKQELFFKGSPSNIAPPAGNYIKHFVDHNPNGYTAGTALLLLDVYPLRMA